MEYRGYYIDFNFYNMITVQFCGDDIVFNNIEKAKAFIDTILSSSY